MTEKMLLNLALCWYLALFVHHTTYFATSNMKRLIGYNYAYCYKIYIPGNACAVQWRMFSTVEIARNHQ